MLSTMMKIGGLFEVNRVLKPTAVAIVAIAAAAHGQTNYVWTGALDNNLNIDTNWAGAVQPLGIGSDQPSTPSISDTMTFDSAIWSQKPRTLYTRTSRKWGCIFVKNGTVDWKNDSNNQGNYSWSGTNTLVVGDGDLTPAEAQFNVVNWNHGGSTGTKTYVINSDGHLSSSRGGAHSWSKDGEHDTVMRLMGGQVTIVGELKESDFLDTDDYVSFEAAGSSFTFTKGTVAGQFQTIADVRSHMGAGKAFRAADGFIIEATDDGASFTIESSLYVPSGTVIVIR